MIFKVFATLLLPIAAFAFFPMIAGTYFLNDFLIPPFSIYEDIAYWMGMIVVQIWWISILARLLIKKE